MLTIAHQMSISWVRSVKTYLLKVHFNIIALSAPNYSAPTSSSGPKTPTERRFKKLAFLLVPTSMGIALRVGPGNYWYCIFCTVRKLWTLHFGYFLEIMDIAFWVLPGNYGHWILGTARKLWTLHFAHCPEIMDIAFWVLSGNDEYCILRTFRKLWI